MEINPQKTVCGCPCDMVIKNSHSHTVLSFSACGVHLSRYNREWPPQCSAGNTATRVAVTEWACWFLKEKCIYRECTWHTCTPAFLSLLWFVVFGVCVCPLTHLVVGLWSWMCLQSFDLLNVSYCGNLQDRWLWGLEKQKLLRRQREMKASYYYLLINK